MPVIIIRIITLCNVMVKFYTLVCLMLAQRNDCRRPTQLTFYLYISVCRVCRVYIFVIVHVGSKRLSFLMISHRSHSIPTIIAQQLDYEHCVHVQCAMLFSLRFRKLFIFRVVVSLRAGDDINSICRCIVMS